MFLRSIATALLCAAILVSACGGRGQEEPVAVAAPPPHLAGSRTCVDCHADESSRWQGSHHALAMQHATDDTVLGDFSDTEFHYFSVTSRFYREDGEFRVRTDDADGEPQDFRIAYTYGVEPLQQYLIEFPGGRIQALPVAWDSRPADQGGQRWFHLYPDEFISSADPLHWTGREQNWNYMCAECHSTGLEKHYDLKSDTFATTWFEISVGCEACHGPASRHVESATNDSAAGIESLPVDLDDTAGATWRMNPVTGIAERSVMLTSPPRQPEACGRCHSRRSAASPEYRYGRPLTDTHRPALLEEGLYFADGQVLDEVYVYGSFLQSRMYQAGVTCSDCHDPHSLALKTTGAASDVCGTCHHPARFATDEHRRHPDGAADCVDCHMPSRDYMVVDGRRDHSFRVPRPDLTIATGSPNACNQCHGDRDAAWADDVMRDWYGDYGVPHYAHAIHAARTGGANANGSLVAAIDNPVFPGIGRATALTLLGPPMSREAMDAVRRALANPDPLMRSGALRALRHLPPELQVQWGGPLLADPARSVRNAAADLLSPHSGSLSPSLRADFDSASREYVDSQLAIAERPEALGNLGNHFAEAGEWQRAEQFYRVALDREPGAVSIRVNLADLYRQAGREGDAERVLREGFSVRGNHAPLHHALGLALVRTGRPEEALEELALASTAAPEISRYAFVHAIALNSLGRADAALAALRDARDRFPNDFDIAWSTVTMLRDQNRLDEARRAAIELTARFPGSEDARALKESLARQ